MGLDHAQERIRGGYFKRGSVASPVRLRMEDRIELTMDYRQLFLAQTPITAIEIEGFKAIKDRVRLDIKPLTVLAGTNSSGKSSAFQPLLLMKQTLELAANDPGPLYLSGPNAPFSGFSETLSHTESGGGTSFRFRVEHTIDESKTQQDLLLGEVTLSTFLETSFRKAVKQTPSVEIDEWIISTNGLRTTIKEQEYPIEELHGFESHFYVMEEQFTPQYYESWSIRSIRCLPAFFAKVKPNVLMVASVDGPGHQAVKSTNTPQRSIPLLAEAVDRLDASLAFSIHVPGLRGRPERVYETAGKTNGKYPQLFQNYIATLLVNDENNLVAKTAKRLRELRLTSGIKARKVDDTRIEVLVDRLPVSSGTDNQGDGSDMVSIADVGIGVSQVLPVIIALEVAVRGQLVYIEQPELHLHPRAQHKLAELLVEAANRGVRVVIETHSDLLLLGIQAAVAKGELDPKSLAMHWFSRDAEGFTKVNTADVDEYGRFGDWPVDFGDVDLAAQSRYLDAVESRYAAKPRVGGTVGP